MLSQVSVSHSVHRGVGMSRGEGCEYLRGWVPTTHLAGPMSGHGHGVGWYSPPPRDMGPASEWVLIPPTWDLPGGTRPTPTTDAIKTRTVGERAVRILLECLLVNSSLKCCAQKVQKYFTTISLQMFSSQASLEI